MNRWEFVVQASTAPEQVPLLDLARMLVHTLEQNEAEGSDPSQDPATLILGAYIAFHTHADVSSRSGYRDLLDYCHLLAENPKVTQ